MATSILALGCLAINIFSIAIVSFRKVGLMYLNARLHLHQHPSLQQFSGPHGELVCPLEAFQETH